MAKTSRRSVLRAGVVLAASSVPLGLGRQALSFVAGPGAGSLRRSVFAPHVGSRVMFVGRGTRHAAKLTQVGDAPYGAAGHDLSFRLVFRTRGAGPGQGTYRLQHRALGGIDLFVSPIGAKPGVYEAIVDART